MPVNFDLNRALTSTEYAKMCYINYKYKGNTMEIPDEDFGRIIGHYNQSTIASWAKYSDDENQYEFTDDEHNDALEDGKQKGRDLTGYDNDGADKFDQTARVVGDGVMAGASGVRAVSGAGNMVKNAADGVKGGTNTLEKVGGAAEGIYQGEQAVVEGGVASAKETCNWLLLASCALDLAMGIFAVAKPANKEQAEACEDLTKEMPTLQDDSYNAASDIMTWNEELQEMGDDAVEMNNEANGVMSDNRGSMEFHLRTIEYFKSAQVAGYTLTQEDYDAYQASMNYMAELDKNNDDVYTVTDEDKQDILKDMKDYEGNFDDAATTIDEVQGVTDFSEEFDEKTETACMWEKYLQWINMGGAVIDAAQATMRAIGPVQWIIYAPAAIAAAAGAVMSGIAAGKQGEYQKTAATEVELREQTQQVNEASRGTYDENIDYYEGYVEDVENLALVRPDDYEVPTEPLPEPGDDPEDPEGGKGGRDGNQKPKRP